MLETIQLCMHITRRNWTVYRKDFIANISPTLADPFFMILSLGVGLGYFINNVEGRSYISYLAPGLAVATALFTAFFETSYGFFVRMEFESIFAAMLTTPIGFREVILGEFFWVTIKGAAMFSMVSLVLAAFGLMDSFVYWPLTPVVGALVALPCGAMGLLATSYIRNINQFQAVYAFLIAPLYMFSGVFFPVERMADSIRWIAESLPLYHGVRLAQAIFWRGDAHPGEILFHAAALVAFSLVLCTWAYYRIRDKLQKA
jgi:lipooligosaccharide transport system permease protein